MKGVVVMPFRRFIFVLTLFFSLISIQPAHAFIIINEFLADPAPGAAGDANNDGVTSSNADEFIELVNAGIDPVDISGWSLSDATRVRHIFGPSTVLDSMQYMVIFGGGSPVLPEINWQTASTGTLSLNNGGDTIFLSDINSAPADQVTYGAEAAENQSLTRYPDGTRVNFQQHSTVPTANGRLYSPGTPVDPYQSGGGGQPTVPEPGTWAMVGMGVLGLWKRRKMGF
jgi:hypothetical protein